MSMFENKQYQWRETYFVLFESAKRPTLKKIEKAITSLNGRLAVINLAADDSGRFESMTVLSPDDFAALDICYLAGEEVREQGAALTEEMQIGGCREEDRATIEEIRRADARLDVLHFEQATAAENSEDAEEMLDPSTLLIILDALTKLTEGIAIDPQNGAMA